MHSSARQAVFQLHLRKGARDRPAEDAVASRLLIWALAEACSVADGARLDLGLRPSVDGVAQDTEQVKVLLPFLPSEVSRACHVSASGRGFELVV